MPKTDPTGSPGDVNLETHPLVAKLHADPDQLTDLVALVGYLGPSKREGYVRLYVDLSFRNYYEIPNEGIVSTSPTNASDENSPTTVHVAGDTQVDKVSITSQSTEARFLQGSISSGYLSGAGTGTDVGCSWPTSPSCWCSRPANCHQGAAQAAQPYTDTVYHTCACTYGQATCNNCGQAGAQANAVDWPGSPTCWCGSHTCQPGAAQVGQPYTDTVYHTCACTIENYTCHNCGVAGAQANAQYYPPSPGSCYGTCGQPNCGQAGAQANAALWPASPTCWCNITRNCNQQAAARAAPQYWPASPTCWFCNPTQHNCAQAGAAEVGCSWPASPTCWCVHTSQGCT